MFTEKITRRSALTAMASAATIPALTGSVALGAEVRRASRPKPPYRVWFQPRLFQRDIDLYRNMTVDASGWLDPRLSEAVGKTTLDWVYGLNHPYADGPGYWEQSCSVSERLRPKAAEAGFVSAGIAIDEWVPPKLPQNPEWLAEGLRAGKQANPDVFIAAWITDPTPPLFDLVNDGTIDLVLVQAYTHSVEPGLTTSWEGALRRCDALANANLADKTICCFGHITDRPDSRGGQLKKAWLAEKSEEIKKRYPTMPGVAFFQSTDPDTPALRDLIKHCDRLSGDLWPSE